MKDDGPPLSLPGALAAAGVIAIPAILIGAFPVAALALLALRLGLDGAGTVLLIDGLMSLAMTAVPLASRGWLRVRLHQALDRRDGRGARRVVLAAIAFELAIGGAAVGALAVTAPWVAERAFDRTVPWELVALAAGHAVVRRIANLAASIAAAARKHALWPATLALVELTVASTIVAALAASPRAVFIGDLVLGGALTALALASAWREVARVLDGYDRDAEAPTEPATLLTPWGNWLASLARGTMRPLIATIAGLAAVAPFAAAGTLQTILVGPLVLVAMMPAPSLVSRVARAVVLAALALALTAWLGPTLFRWVYPDGLAGGAAYLSTTAWLSLALLLSPLYRGREEGRTANQWLAALSALVTAGLLLWSVYGGPADLDRLLVAWTAAAGVGMVVMFIDRGASGPARSSGVQP